MKLTDFVLDFLAKQGVKYVFGLTGGAVVHLFDSADKHPEITPIFNHHEQAGALAAESYARVRNNLGACFITTGPGGTNAITGLTAAWLDSLPCIYISGQSRYEHTSRNKPVRQIGCQELDIISIVESITKYAVMIEDPKQIKYELQKATYIAKSGRTGPVWIDIPLNYQWVDINPKELEEFNPKEWELDVRIISEQELNSLVLECKKLLLESRRPLILAGYGIRLSNAMAEFKKLIKKLKIPFISTWGASDIISNENYLYVGRPGMAGQRGANLAMQNCDLLICIGSHLSLPITGTDYKAFAREAKIIVVDIDKTELDFDTVKVDVKIQVDAMRFIKALLGENNDYPIIDTWKKRCEKFKKYNTIPKEWRYDQKYLNPYVFIDTISDFLTDKDTIVVDGGGTVVYTSFQALKLKEGQRVVLSTGTCAMGTGLPEAIGACFGRNKGRTVCFVGDGSMQLNIQELQTIVHHNLPIKIFVFNNRGYLSIRHTQNEFLNRNYVGSKKEGGLSLPDYIKIAQAYGIKAKRLTNYNEFCNQIEDILKTDKPILCEILISKTQEVIPRKGFKKNPDGTFSSLPLEDMYPRLNRKEFNDLMIIEQLPESKE